MIDLYWCEKCDTRLRSDEMNEGAGVLVSGRAWCKSHKTLAKVVRTDADTLHGQSGA
jgi:hypothetical protein